MADTLKEIYKGTILFSDIASTGAVTLASTDALTQYVIKDVQVSGVLVTGTTPYLTVNDVNVATASTNASGSEIVDINSTIKYKAFSAAPIVLNTSYKGFTYPLTYINSTITSVGGVTVPSTVTASSTVATGITNLVGMTSNQVGQVLVGTNGDVFYVTWNGNDGATLYKRSGGPTGSESTLQTMSYGWIVSNGIDAYHYVNGSSGVIYKYNINTASTTSVSTGVQMSQSSYPSAYYMANGMIAVNTSGNTDPTGVYIVNPATAAYTYLTLPNSVSFSGTAYRLSAYYNATTGLYTIYRKNGGTLYKCQLNSAFTVGAGYGGSYSEVSASVPSTISNNAYVTQDSTTYSYGLHNVLNKTQISTYDFSTATTTTVDWFPFGSYSQMFSYTQSVGLGSTVTSSITARITGIKSV